MSACLKLMSSRMSSRASHRCHQYAILASSSGSFYRRLFSYVGSYKYKTSAFVTGKCRLKVKSAGGTCQDGGNMAYDGVFSDMRIEEKWTGFHESWTSGWCLFCDWAVSASLVTSPVKIKNPAALHAIVAQATCVCRLRSCRPVHSRH